MKYQLVKKTPENHNLVVGFFSDEDIFSQSHIQEFGLSDFIKANLQPKTKHSGLWIEHNNQAVLLFNMGKKDKCSIDAYQACLSLILKQIKTIKSESITLCLPEIKTCIDHVKFIVQSIESNFYNFKISENKRKAPALKAVDLLINGEESSIKQALAIAEAVKLAKDLGNLPPNLCTPSIIAEYASEIANYDPKIQLKILGEKEMAELGMNTILAVSKGSSEEAKFIELNYANGGDSAPIVLVGKGITFDSGGLSLKPPSGMMEMKFDMCGAASVLGAMKAASLLQLPLNVIVLVSASENLPGPDALKPGDIIESYSKKTIEVLNTDAEGRLVLCDALTYAEQFKPAKVVDVATLTGAIIVALGDKANGIMANNQQLCDELLIAGQTANDKGWQLPLWDEYQSLMDSNVADLSNMSSSKGAGSISAACFLSKFAEKYPWAHIDCAGTAWRSGKNKLASGRPVPLLVQFLQDQVK